MENLFFIAIGNVIKESPFGYFYKILSHSKEGITCCEHSKTKNKNKEEFPISYEDLIAGMDEKTYSVEGMVYENERDKALLQLEISAIKTNIELDELKKSNESAIAEWAEKEKNYKAAIAVYETPSI